MPKPTGAWEPALSPQGPRIASGAPVWCEDSSKPCLLPVGLGLLGSAPQAWPYLLPGLTGDLGSSKSHNFSALLFFSTVGTTSSQFPLTEYFPFLSLLGETAEFHDNYNSYNNI